MSGSRRLFTGLDPPAPPPIFRQSFAVAAVVLSAVLEQFIVETSFLFPCDAADKTMGNGPLPLPPTQSLTRPN